MDRRSFARRSLIATLGLLTGAEAVEAFERLTYTRKYWPGFTPQRPYFETVRDGAWSDPATWGGEVPYPEGGSAITIRHAVAMDDDVCSENEVIFTGQGKVTLSPASTFSFNHCASKSSARPIFDLVKYRQACT